MTQQHPRSTVARQPRPPRPDSHLATALGVLAVLAACLGMVAGGAPGKLVRPSLEVFADLANEAPAPQQIAEDAGGRRRGGDERAEAKKDMPAGLTASADTGAAPAPLDPEALRRLPTARARKLVAGAMREQRQAAPVWRREGESAAEPPASPAPPAEPSVEEMPLADMASPRRAAPAAAGATAANVAEPATAVTSSAEAFAERDASGGKGERGRTKQAARASGVAGELEKHLARMDDDGDDRGLGAGAGPRGAARRFLAAQRSLGGLAFKEPTGYWANTYVPGDPDMRVLESRLRRFDDRQLAAMGAPRLEPAVRQNPQPFDAPDDAALAVYLQADRAALEGAARLRVQVGLGATARRSGLRPAMNVAVVLDLRRVPDAATAARLRALVLAVARARQPGDRFFLVAAGPGGGVVTEPDQFRHGPLGLAMDDLLRHGDGVSTDLATAIRLAADSVRQGDDPDRPLGASLVLLAATAPIGAGSRALDELVHANAVDGVALSVVAAGDTVPMDDVDRLVLLGQGQRRVLAAPGDAPRVVERELYASSRTVARAVRLRIRLAPGVRLVDVIGSHRLDERSAVRVREAEQSIDRRLAHQLGIRADRGDDEEGIQIVIPAFYADDSHAILLDVVAPGPGPVADVTVRYKDLAFRRNGVSRANLTLSAGRRDDGPLERNVLKNLLAHEVASAARAAAERIARGDWPGARALLGDTYALVAGMRELVPGWADDAELAGDERVLAEYVVLVERGTALAAPQRAYVMDSLRYLAFRRLVPPPPVSDAR